MSSVPPSERVAKEIDALCQLKNGLGKPGLGLMRLGWRLVQEALGRGGPYLKRAIRRGGSGDGDDDARPWHGALTRSIGRQKDASGACLRCAIRPNLIGPSYGLFSR